MGNYLLIVPCALRKFMVQESRIVMQKNAYGTIGERLKNFRCVEGYSQEGFAKELEIDYREISKSVISRIESGKQLPTTTLLYSIHRVFEVSIEELLFGENIKEVSILSKLKPLSTTQDSEKKRIFDDYIKECENYTVQKIDDDDEKTCIREAREENGISVKDMADNLKVSNKTVYRLENGDSRVPLKHLLEYCRLFDLSLDYIIIGEFIGLPDELQGLLGGYSYYTQIELMREFISIAKKFSLL